MTSENGRGPSQIFYDRTARVVRYRLDLTQIWWALRRLDPSPLAKSSSSLKKLGPQHAFARIFSPRRPHAKAEGRFRHYRVPRHPVSPR